MTGVARAPAAESASAPAFAPAPPTVKSTPPTTGRTAQPRIPKRDPADQPFRRGPMAQSSRSIAIPLAPDLHIAFDARLLRTHTAWKGPSLNLLGTPYHGAKSPFLCTFDGETLWTMPPFCPWNVTIPTAEYQSEPPTGSDFKGLSMQDGLVTLTYAVAAGHGEVISIRETPRALLVEGMSLVVRRLDLGPCARDLWFLAHAEMGRANRTSPDRATWIERDKNLLVSVARGFPEAGWKIEESSVSYDVPLEIERNGESAVEKIHVTGWQTRAYLRLPSHTHPVTVEVISAICRDAPEAVKLTATLASSTPPEPSRIHADQSPAPGRPKTARVVSGDPALPQRPGGDDYYRIEHFPVPREIALQVTGMDWLPNGDLAIATWSGEIYIVEGAQGDVQAARYRRFARGLNEPLGLQVVKEQIYVVQKCDLTRITDTDGDGEADQFETINDDWAYSGNYHAFAFGPVIDRDQNFYAFLCGQRGRWDLPYVGWCVQIKPDGSNLEGFCSGLRAPNGFGLYGPNDDLFIADNQGNWVGACKLNHLQRGRFYGYPSGIPAPEADYAHPAQFEPPAVWFPRKLSPSTSGFVTVDSDRFGPFPGQMLIGDFQNAVVSRVFLEKVHGAWQGAVWPFAKGFYSGVNRLAMGRDGKLYVGGLKNAAWPASAPKDYSLDRVEFTGQTPFEIKEVHATAAGFELVFTQPVDPTAAAVSENYEVAQFNYEYHQAYGSPEIDQEGRKDSSTPLKTISATVSPDRRKVQLALGGTKLGYVTMVRALDLQSAAGKPLWHETFYYTLNHLPQ